MSVLSNTVTLYSSQGAYLLHRAQIWTEDRRVKLGAGSTDSCVWAHRVRWGQAHLPALLCAFNHCHRRASSQATHCAPLNMEGVKPPPRTAAHLQTCKGSSLPPRTFVQLQTWVTEEPKSFTASHKDPRNARENDPRLHTRIGLSATAHSRYQPYADHEAPCGQVIVDASQRDPCQRFVCCTWRCVGHLPWCRASLRLQHRTFLLPAGCCTWIGVGHIPAGRASLRLQPRTLPLRTQFFSLSSLSRASRRQHPRALPDE